METDLPTFMFNIAAITVPLGILLRIMGALSIHQT